MIAMSHLMSLGLALILSSTLGLEREFNNQPAGLRTHILIGLGSTLLMILSMEIAQLPGYINGDPGRIAAQVVTGIGFIGAGAIMKIGLNTKGLTTAANIWVTSAIGLTTGAGLYTIAIVATMLILFNLTIITKIKKRIVKQFRYCHIEIHYKKKKISEKSIIKKIKTMPMNIVSKDIKTNSTDVTIKILSRINNKISLYDIYSEIEKLREVDNNIKISITENMK